MSETVILMAAGLGTRMRPLTEKLPKPLVTVQGKPMIETVLDAFQKRGVGQFIVVTGYLREQFSYLEKKYPNLQLVYNRDYERMNNISSVYAAAEWLEQSDCFICEADLYISDPDIFCRKLEKSCYFAKWLEGYSADWVFDVEKGRITHIHKEASDAYNMAGVSYFQKKDAERLAAAVRAAYEGGEASELFWDEVADTILDEIEMTICPVQEGQIIEIDTIEELANIDREGKV